PRLVSRRHLRPHGAEDLGGQRRVGLDDAAALAGRAPRGEEPAEVLAHTLSGHLDQAELGDLEHVGARLVPGERLLERLFDLLPVLLVLHVDEVDDDDAAKVAEPDLADDLAHRLEVDLEHGLVEVPLTDVLARVHVDRDERLGVVDHDVAAGLEPHPAPERLLDVLLDAERLEDWLAVVVEPHAPGERRHQGLHVPQALVVDLLRVDDELVHLGREEITHDAEDEVAFLVQDGRRLPVLVPGLDLRPEAGEELDVGGELRLALALGVRAEDEPARREREAPKRRAQAVALLLVADPTGNADVAGLRYVDDVPARQRDERRDAGALRAEGLLRDLHEDLLPLAEQVLDRDVRLAVALRLLDVHGIGVREAGAAVLVGARQHGARVVAEVGRVVAGVEEGVLVEPDIDERRLHARQHVRHDALVHATHDRTVTVPLDVELGEEITLLDPDARLGDSSVDDDPFAHGSTSPTPAPRRDGASRGPGVSLELP